MRIQVMKKNKRWDDNKILIIIWVLSDFQMSIKVISVQLKPQRAIIAHAKHVRHPCRVTAFWFASDFYHAIKVAGRSDAFAYPFLLQVIRVGQFRYRALSSSELYHPYRQVETQHSDLSSYAVWCSCCNGGCGNRYLDFYQLNLFVRSAKFTSFHGQNSILATLKYFCTSNTQKFHKAT